MKEERNKPTSKGIRDPWPHVWNADVTGGGYRTGPPPCPPPWRRAVPIQKHEASSNLKECSKAHKRNSDLVEDVKRIQRAGIQFQGGFIVGFDNNPPSIFQRQINFIQRSGIVTAMVAPDTCGSCPRPLFVQSAATTSGRSATSMRD